MSQIPVPHVPAEQWLPLHPAPKAEMSAGQSSVGELYAKSFAVGLLAYMVDSVGDRKPERFDQLAEAATAVSERLLGGLSAIQYSPDAQSVYFCFSEDSIGAAQKIYEDKFYHTLSFTGARQPQAKLLLTLAEIAGSPEYERIFWSSSGHENPLAFRFREGRKGDESALGRTNVWSVPCFEGMRRLAGGYIGFGVQGFQDLWHFQNPIGQIAEPQAQYVLDAERLIARQYDVEPDILRGRFDRLYNMALSGFNKVSVDSAVKGIDSAMISLMMEEALASCARTEDGKITDLAPFSAAVKGVLMGSINPEDERAAELQQALRDAGDNVLSQYQAYALFRDVDLNSLS